MTTPLHEIGNRVLRFVAESRDAEIDVTAGDDRTYRLSYTGPGGSTSLPEDIASYEFVSKQPASWVGVHRLRVTSPSTVLDLMWNDGEPLRIMSYCRGDWEQSLTEALR